MSLQPGKTPRQDPGTSDRHQQRGTAPESADPGSGATRPSVPPPGICRRCGQVIAWTTLPDLAHCTTLAREVA